MTLCELQKKVAYTNPSDMASQFQQDHLTWNICTGLERKLNYYTWAYQKVTSSELLKEEAIKKKVVLYTKNKYILKLLFNVVTA
jgi:hypothetical protein